MPIDFPHNPSDLIHAIISEIPSHPLAKTAAAVLAQQQLANAYPLKSGRVKPKENAPIKLAEKLMASFDTSDVTNVLTAFDHAIQAADSQNDKFYLLQTLNECVTAYRLPLNLFTKHTALLNSLKPILEYVDLKDWSTFSSQHEFENFIKEFPQVSILNLSNQKNITTPPERLKGLECENTDSIKLPRGMHDLQFLYCRNCTGLTTLPDDMHSLQCLVCENCPSLTKLPNGMHSLQGLYCWNCTGLPELPEGVPNSLIISNTGCSQKFINSCNIHFWKNGLKGVISEIEFLRLISASSSRDQKQQIIEKIIKKLHEFETTGNENVVTLISVITSLQNSLTS